MKKIIVLLFVLFSFVGHAQSVTSVTKYRTGKLYPINELVSKDGVIYKALVSTTASPPSVDWQDALSGGGAETDPIFIAWDKSSGILITESQISDLTHITDTDTHIDQTGIEAFGFVAGAHTTDTNTQLSQANVGTFATAEGFIKTFSELDPIYSAWNKSTGISITESQISDLTHTTDTDDQTGAEVNLTGYVKPGTTSPVSATDNVNQAIGKLEKGIDDATSGGVTSVAGKTGVVTLVEADITDLTHTTDTNTQLSQANVGTFATAEGFIKSVDLSNYLNLDGVQTVTGVKTFGLLNTSNITLENSGSYASISVQSLEDGSGHVGALMEMFSSGWGEGGFKFGSVTYFSLIAGYTVIRTQDANGLRINNSTDDSLVVVDNSGNGTFLGTVSGSNLSGANSGDQDISGITTNAGAITTLQTNNTGTNTGDQVLTDYAKKDGLDRVENSNTAITISSGDYGTIIYCTGTSAITVTIPDTLTAIDGQTFSIVQWSAFQVSIVGSGTTTIKSTSATEKTLEEASAIQFIHIGTDSDDWHAVGSLEDN